MDLEVYRSSDPNTDCCWDYSEICRDCAKKEIEKGNYVEYDKYLSEKTTDLEEECCQICEGDFFNEDTPEDWIRLEGAVY